MFGKKEKTWLQPEQAVIDLQNTIAEQQLEIQELKSDPVRGLKEIVNEFNLK